MNKEKISKCQYLYLIYRTNSIWYIVLVVVTCVCINLTSLFTNFRKGDLTYREWTPYEYSHGMYYITYFRQLISLTTAGIVNVACDCIICGLLMHICCQIDILKCRLRKALHNRNDFNECVRQHDRIFKSVFLRKILRKTFCNFKIINYALIILFIQILTL